MASKKNESIIHVTVHSKTHKLAGIESISTAVLKNPICENRRHCENSVCQHCFAVSLTKMYSSLESHLENNLAILSSRLLTEEEVNSVNINTVLGRIESFGDVRNITQAINYIRIIRHNSETHFAIWSKNQGIWAAAFRKEGKPENCTFVVSSMFLNVRTSIIASLQGYVDHVFTVWSDKESYQQAITNNPGGACAGYCCMNCRKCYRADTCFYIDELLRK